MKSSITRAISCAALLFVAVNSVSAQKQRLRAQRPKGSVVDQKPAAKGPFAVSGTFSGIRELKKVVIRDQKAFEELWKQHQPQGGTPLPSVDFKNCDVVAVFAGSKTTGGYTVEIGPIERKGKSAAVHAAITKPGPGSMTIQAFTYPFAMVGVPKLPAEVKFVIKEVVRADK